MEDAEGDVAGDPSDAESRLRRYSYLTSREFPRTYFAIMRVFSSTLLADLSATDVSNALFAAERDGRIEPGESSVDRVVDRLTQLRKWGNLVPGRRETNAKSIAEFAHGSLRYQVDKLALRIHREAEALLAIPEGAREVSRELLPAIRRGLDDAAGTISAALVAERLHGSGSSAVAKLRERLSEQVTTLFLQHAELAATVRDFYAHVGQVVARHDLNPEEIAGFRGLLVEYIQLVVDDVMRHTTPIAETIGTLETALPEVLRLLAPTAELGESVERARGRSMSDWRGLTDWFVERPGQVSQVGALREATAKAIGSLLANVKRATGGGDIAPGRRTELIRLARRFDESTVEEAHGLYAESFGVWGARHWLLAPDVDDTLPTTPWRDGMRTPVPVSMSSRGDRAARGRTAKIVENPLGEQLALVEAQEQARRREAAYAELRAAAARLEEVTLSAGALDVLYDLLRRAMSHRERVDGAGEFLHTPSQLRVRVGPLAGVRCHIRAAHGTLTLHDVAVHVEVCEGASAAESPHG
ncbi:DUF2397 domain-containing protein [Micromonospora sp. CPCC 205558]|uniref:DUF2397 domain-containing protein n=1 Tax=Micromonospora sp. CPCC 205558 TaxID=3122403 RepID=UPI002FF01299